MPQRLRSLVTAIVVTPWLAGAVHAQAPRGGRPQPVDPRAFQFMGPASGGRISAIVGVPGDTNVWYIGSASGGVWKSSDAGHTFEPVSDSIPGLAIGALAVAPSQPNTVWAGTGEAWVIRDADLMGDGVYKSTDAGATWVHMGLENTGRIGRIIVHPRHPDIVFVCALGRTTGPQQERGVYRTTDGGTTWQRVLFVDPNTGCSGLSMSTQDPNTLFAGMWQVEMHTWAMFSGGPGSGIYVSHDGGTTWAHVTDAGLPKSPIGKIDVAVAPSDSNRVYALMRTADQGSVWRSDDAGRSWRVINWQRTLIGRAGYYIRLAVNPQDPDEVLLANSSFFKSNDGGMTFQQVNWGGDNHDIWYDPTNPDRIGNTDDGGARISTDHGRTGIRVSIANGQMYHVAVDNQMPYWIYSNRQDDGTMRGPSDAPEAAPNSGRGRGGFGGGAPPRPQPAPADTTAAGRGGAGGRGDTTVARAAAPPAGRGRGFGRGGRGGGFNPGFTGSSTWDNGLGGCESGFTLPDPTNPDIVWASCYGDEVTRYDARVDAARSVSPYLHTLDAPPTDIRYRCHWTPPLAIDPFDHNTVYYGCQVIFRTSNGGQSWQVISPDLSTHDTSRIVSSGGVSPDNLGQFYGEVVFAIAPSALQRGLIWAGTNDGLVWLTRDGGKHWTNVTANIPGLPAWGTVRKIEPSSFDAGTAYLAVDFHLMDDRKPYIYKTTDYGHTWTNITGDLPTGGPLDYVMAVTENPNRRGMLFAGTGHGFYYSLDDGGHWVHYQDGLPAAEVTWIVVPKVWHDVVVSTYGRGLYILHDITWLEQSDQPTGTRPATFYPPRPGYRNARQGHADFLFSLASPPRGQVQLDILDAKGAVLRTMTGTARAGFNRVSWDLRLDGPDQIALKTLAPDNPHIWDDPRFKGRDTRPIIHWGIEGPERNGPLAAPGRYVARLVVDSQSYTQPLTVLKDPAVPAAEADLVASYQTQRRIVADIDTTVSIVNRLETMRKQVADQIDAHAGDPALVAPLQQLGDKLYRTELLLVTRSDLESDDKYYVEAYRVYLNLIWLYGEVGPGAGDVAGGSDARPTDAEMAALESLERDLQVARRQFEGLVTRDVPTFNRSMAGKLQPISSE
jgi:photosystem II stability/assembly factor-like uncharacterized protein